MMEQHPIPQDITGFKFKLVGDMTLVQFGYLAAGLIGAWIFYAAPWYAFIRYPLAAISALSGTAFAFLPVEDRPLAIWVKNFFHAIYRPTFLVWEKTASVSLDSPLITNDFQPKGWTIPTLSLWPTKSTPTQSTPPPIQIDTPPSQPIQPSPVQEEKNKHPQFVQDVVVPEVVPTKSVPNSELPTTNPDQIGANRSNVLSIDELVKMRESKLAELAAEKDNFAKAQVELQKQKYQAAKPVNNVIDISSLENMRQAAGVPKISPEDAQLQQLINNNAAIASQINDIKFKEQNIPLQERQILEDKLAQLNASRDQLAEQISQMQKTLSQYHGQSASSVTFSIDPSVKIMTRNTASPTLSLSDQPNVISGLIKDNTGQSVVGAIVLINDSAGKPVRALKTNKIGQFITSTPLDSGQYYLEIEKEGLSFDTIMVTLSGQIVPILEISGKIISNPATATISAYGSA